MIGCDMDFTHLEVRDEMMKWGEWYVDTTDVDGFRFDAVKHVRAGFFPAWIQHVTTTLQKRAKPVIATICAPYLQTR